MPVPDPPPTRPLPAAPPRHAPSPALDRFGAAVSCACAAHCVLLPGAVALLPALGVAWLLDDRVEWGLLATALVIGVASLGPAAWRGRGARGAFGPVLLFAAGAALLVAARMGVGEAAETPLVLAGAALVAAAHLANQRRARCRARQAAAAVGAAAAAALLAVGVATPATAGAQAPAGAAVRGTVVRADDGRPLPGARVRIDEADAPGRTAAITDSAGRFLLAGLPAGPVRLVARWGAFPERTLPLALRDGDTLHVVVRLAAQAARLGGVVVTAREGRGGAEGGTASVVGRAAIEHLQASSVADVLQLVPGQLAANPTLDGARQAVVRTALPASAAAPRAEGDVARAAADAARATALGTAVVVDGVPLSNNANMQTSTTILNSGPSALPAFSSTANRGVDLRLLPADNVERVEVVRGVPSARHGDLTAGAVFVTSRSGPRAPELRARANPTLFEASAVAGWGGALPGPFGAPARAAAARGLNLDANLVASQDDPRAAEGIGRRSFAVARAGRSVVPREVGALPGASLIV